MRVYKDVFALLMKNLDEFVDAFSLGCVCVASKRAFDEWYIQLCCYVYAHKKRNRVSILVQKADL